MQKISKEVFSEPKFVIKRDGSIMPFDRLKIKEAIRCALLSVPYENMEENELEDLVEFIVLKFHNTTSINIETIQDIVEESLIEKGKIKTAKSYILYRDNHKKIRNSKIDLMNLYKEITFKDSKNVDLKRENANIDANTAMGTMLKYGSEGSKYFVDEYILPQDIRRAHENGYIHIHDKDFYMLTKTCCQINLSKLFKNGFSTGHGHITTPNSIGSYAALTCIVLQANQNEMHGGQAIPDFDFALSEGVEKSYRKKIKEALNNTLLRHNETFFDLDKNKREEVIEDIVENFNVEFILDNEEKIIYEIESYLNGILGLDEKTSKREAKIIKNTSYELLEKETFQAMQALIHNLNTMNSRAGAQVPFSSINYGTCTKESGRMVIRELLKATDKGLGDGETPIFPVHIFKVKDGINYFENDKNYDLFRLACKTSCKRLFPNFSFLDSSFNKKYYKEGKVETEVAYMGCRTRVMGNVFDKDREITYGRGNLSFTSINLPRLAIEARGDIKKFYSLLNEKLELIKNQLLHRFKIQAKKKKYNYPFLMGEGIWIDSEKLNNEDEVYDVIKHGTLTIGFIGLSECLIALRGKHHGEDEISQKLGLDIVSFMRDYCDLLSLKYNLNFSLIGTPAEGLSGRFVKLDKEKYGEIEGVTDKDYYTNSFHVPVYFKTTIEHKIDIEAPYHKLTNGGHISYVEVDGDLNKNVDAFISIIKYMKEKEIGYGSINHPVDYDPVCKYSGIIDNVCPRCKRQETKDKPFKRIRRITGYLVGDLDRFNDAKKKEVMDCVKHRRFT